MLAEMGEHQPKGSKGYAGVSLGSFSDRVAGVELLVGVRLPEHV